MMFRWTIKQPRTHRFWNVCCLYQDIYDWIYSNTAVYGEKWVVVFVVTCIYFRFFEALNGAFKVQFFFRASFLHISDTDSM